MKIRVSSDSTCDLSAELIQKYDIGIIPLYILMDGKTYCDGIDITKEDIFAHIENGGASCSTAAVSITDYADYFRKERETHDAVIHFTISSDMSSCYQNACIAAEEVGSVYVVDARNLSTGIGHLAIDASIMAKEGMNPADIKAVLDAKKEKLDVSFILDTLKYLQRGGRCSALASFGANLLSLKPCIEVRSGKMGVGKSYRGNLEKCFLKYVEDKLKNQTNVNYDRIFITHSGVNDEIVDHVEAKVRECGPFKEVLRTSAGCTISNHCGPNCLGILFYRT